jgi:hypothetical protein
MALHGLRAGDRVHVVAGTATVSCVVDAAVEADEVAILRPLGREDRIACRSLPVGDQVEVKVPLGASVRLGRTRLERITSPGGYAVVVNVPFLEQVNRRSSHRVDVVVEVEVAYDDGIRPVVARGRTVNLSVGGMAAQLNPIPEGTPVEVTLHLTAGAVRTPGSVVSESRPGSNVRVAFAPGKHEMAIGTFLNRVETTRPRTRVR